MESILREHIRQRAGDRCEYCHMRQAHDPFYTFPVDHVIAKQHGGLTRVDNLALSCYRCNAHKGPNIASIDTETGELVPLFNPRREIWSDHFEWNGALLRGRTSIGRATVALLAINHPDYVLLREALIAEGVFREEPPSRDSVPT